MIIEPHPDVLDHMRSTGWFSKPGVEVFEGRWQDFIVPEKIEALLGEEGGFDVVYTDTFSEGYGGEFQSSFYLFGFMGLIFVLSTDLYEFFEHLGDLMSGQDAKFSFFNGLGATSTFQSPS